MIVKFDQVGLAYEGGPESLKDVSFALGEGEFRFLTGPSGAGKTSFLKLIYLALKPTRGTIDGLAERGRDYNAEVARTANPSVVHGTDPA